MDPTGQNPNQNKGIQQKMKDISNKATKRAVKAFIFAITHALLIIKIIAVICIITILYSAVEWVLELIRGENNPKTVYAAMEVDDFSDLVEIKGNETTGYYFAFKEGTDDKLIEAANKLDASINNSTIEVENLKKMIQAELVSSYPNLGGEIGQRDDTKETYSFNTLNNMLIIGDDLVAKIKSEGLATSSKLYGVNGSNPSDWTQEESRVNGAKTLGGLPVNSNNIEAIVVILGNNISYADTEIESMKNENGVLAELYERYPDKKIFIVKYPIPENAQNKEQIESFNKEMESYQDERNYIKFIDATNNVKITDVASATKTELQKYVDNIKNEIKKIKFQREKEEFEDDGTGFQGAIKIRRVSPNKEIGEMNKDLGAVFTSYGEYTTTSQNQSQTNQNANNNTQNQDSAQNGENQENSQEGQAQEGQQNTQGQNEENSEQTTNTKIIVLDPGHGEIISEDNGWDKENDEGKYKQNGFIRNAETGEWGEYRHWKSGTDDKECYGTDCNNNTTVIVEKGEWYIATDGNREVAKTGGDEAKINMANALAAKKYLENMGYTVRLTRDENSHPSFAKRSKYCYPNNDTNQNPDAELYVCIHSNATDKHNATGSAYISLSEDSNHYTQEHIDKVKYGIEGNNAGRIINQKIVEQTSLENYSGGEIEDEPDLIAFHKNPCPTAYLEIGFFDNADDLSILNSESDKIGKAIADGIDEYFKHPQGMVSQSAGTTTTEKVNTYSGIKSKVQDLSYVPETTEELTYTTKEVFDEYIKSDKTEDKIEALKHFTLDEDMRLIVASWSYNGNSEPQITVKKSSPINYKTAMSKYFMPFEYLTSFLVDTLDPDFVMDLADLALDSEFIIAVEDNVTTRQTITTNYKRNSTTEDWKRAGSNEGPITESCSVSVELTYADTWFVRAEKESSFSTLSLKQMSETGVLTAKGGISLGTFYITGYCPCSECSEGYGTQTATGTVATPNRTIAVDPTVIPYNTEVIIDGKVYVAEDCGGGVKGNHIDIYVENHEETYDVTGYKEVFKATDVKEEKTDFETAPASNTLLEEGTTTIARGKVEVKEGDPVPSYSDDGLSRTDTSTNSVVVKYETGGSKMTGKEANFASILDKSKNAKENLKPDWLFQVLSKNEKTANMVDLTKYLIYKATGTSYGIEKFDFSVYDLSKFVSAGVRRRLYIYWF